MSAYTTAGFAFAAPHTVYAIGATLDALDADINRECKNACIDRNELEFGEVVPATAAAIAMVEAGVVEVGRKITLHMGTLIASDEYQH